jgi:stage II sporulation protein D
MGMMRVLGRRILPPFLALVPLLSPAGAWSAQVPAAREVAVRIRVRLAEAIPKVIVRGYDLRIHETEARALASAPDRASEWELRCQDGRIRAVPLRGGEGREPLVLQEPVMIHSPTGMLHFRGQPYRQELHVYSQGSLCEVVNEVDIEKYLHGLVNAEFSSKWSDEATAAQVVAARTYAYFQIRKARGDSSQHYDVDSTVRDQVYDGSSKEDARASRAVEKTRGVVLTVGAGAKAEPVKAFYHSTCGGMTELPEHVWGAHFAGFKRAVRCPFCGSSPRFQWNLDLHPREVSEAFLRGARGETPPEGWPRDWVRFVRQQRLLDIRAGAPDETGRVSEVVTLWADGDQVRDLKISGARFRDWMGPAKFRSTAFDVTPHRSALGPRWRFEGRGNGHGVGMCQWGAKVMGERGYAMAAILRHYYPDATLRKLW